MREDDLKKSHELAEQALTELKKAGLSAIPRNFELWHAHLSGQFPSLSDEIQKLQGDDGALTESIAGELYNRYLQHAHLPSAVLDVAQRVEHEISDVLEQVTRSGDSTRVYGKQLNGASAELSRSEPNATVLQTLVKTLLTSTKKVEAENKALESRLNQSSTEIANLHRSMETIRMEAFTDPLTGVGNRKCFDTSIEKFIEEAEGEGHELCIAFADIDHFKKFNDTWGHQTGDQVLRLVAAAMDANIKGQDLLTRYGGEEFAILLPRTSLDNASLLADRIRRTVESRRLRKRSTNEDLGAITISMGVAQYHHGESHDAFVERADQCLYEAKRSGRNRIAREDIVKPVPKSAFAKKGAA